jgi:hypothetical protein
VIGSSAIAVTPTSWGGATPRPETSGSSHALPVGASAHHPSASRSRSLLCSAPAEDDATSEPRRKQRSEFRRLVPHFSGASVRRNGSIGTDRLARFLIVRGALHRDRMLGPRRGPTRERIFGRALRASRSNDAPARILARSALAIRAQQGADERSHPLPRSRPRLWSLSNERGRDTGASPGSDRRA